MSGQSEQAISQESRYKLWRKYVPLLYEVVSTQTLDWPASCVELVDLTKGNWSKVIGKREWSDESRLMLTGTYTGNSKEDTVSLHRVHLPKPCDYEFDDEADYEEVVEESRVRSWPLSSVNHEDEVLCCRSMPQQTHIIASRNSSEIFLYDFSKGATPEGISLQKIPGSSLCWSKHKAGQLVAGADDGSIKVFQIDAHGRKSVAKVTHSLENHSDAAVGFDWSGVDVNILASTGHDGVLKIHDLRSTKAVASISDAHGAKFGVNCVSYHPTDGNILLTGVGWKEVRDSMNLPEKPDVRQWDPRKLSNGPIHEYSVPVSKVIQEDLGVQVYQIRWSPHSSDVFGVCSGDGAVRLWDKSKVGAEFESEAAKEDGPPELRFVHGGHTDAVSDFQFDRTFPDTIVSVADDNICMFWRPLIKI